MRVNVSPCAGFCFGVKRAVGLAEKVLSKSRRGKVYSLGAIIHNRDVVTRLESMGLNTVAGASSCERGSTVIICSHGVHPEAMRGIKRMGVKIEDATCPYVHKAQRYAGMLAKEGYRVVIAGDKRHPEVRSLVGFACDAAAVVSSADEATRLKTAGRKVGVIAQTTQSAVKYREIVCAIARTACAELRVFDTICRDAANRQGLVPVITSANDVIIVVGGKNSANTKRLYELAKKLKREVYHIENAGQLRDSWFKGKRRAGVMSGASTPDWVIEEVIAQIRNV